MRHSFWSVSVYIPKTSRIEPLPNAALTRQASRTPKFQHFLCLRLLACTYTRLLDLCSLLSLFQKALWFFCELHSTESTIASHNTQLVRLEIMYSASRLLSTCSGSLKRDTPHPSACWGLGRVRTCLLPFLCESEGLLYKLATI